MERIRELWNIGAKVVVLVVTLYITSLLGLRLAGFDFTVVLSGSMAPAMEKGDLVILRPNNSNLLKIGDIVQYKKAGKKSQNVLHRITAIESRGIRTKGDANSAPDPVLVSKSEINGVAIGSLKGFGMPILLFKNLLQLSAAQFTASHNRSAVGQSSVWINPIAKWKTISGGGSFTYTSPNSVSSNGSGNRSIFINKNSQSDNTFYTSFKLTVKDPNSSIIYFNLDVCIPVSTITCGWSIGINQTNNFLIVQTYSQTGVRQSPIHLQSFNLDLMNQMPITISSNAENLQMWINGNRIFKIQNPLAVASAQGLNVPSGTFFGFSITNSNQFKSFQTMSW